MNLAIYLGTVKPPLTGSGSLYIDGKPAQPKPPRVKRTDNIRHGERQRLKIMQMVDEWGEVDLSFLVADDCLEICRRGIQVHLMKLVEAGELIRIAPKRRGAGQCIVWRRPEGGK